MVLTCSKPFWGQIGETDSDSHRSNKCAALVPLRNADTNITRFSHRKSPTNQYIGWQEVVRRCHAAAAPHTAPVTARGVRSQRIGTVPVRPNAALSAKRKNPDFTDGILP